MRLTRVEQHLRDSRLANLIISLYTLFIFGKVTLYIYSFEKIYFKDEMSPRLYTFFGHIARDCKTLTYTCKTVDFVDMT